MDYVEDKLQDCKFCNRTRREENMFYHFGWFCKDSVTCYLSFLHSKVKNTPQSLSAFEMNTIKDSRHLQAVKWKPSEPINLD